MNFDLLYVDFSSKFEGIIAFIRIHHAQGILSGLTKFLGSHGEGIGCHLYTSLNAQNRSLQKPVIQAVIFLNNCNEKFLKILHSKDCIFKQMAGFWMYFHCPLTVCSVHYASVKDTVKVKGKPAIFTVNMFAVMLNHISFLLQIYI